MSQSISIETMFGRSTALYAYASAADERGNFDGQVSIEELEAYVGHLEERLRGADAQGRPILAERLRQTREALDDVRYELGRLRRASPEEQKAVLAQAIALAKTYASEGERTNFGYETLVNRARALGLGEGRAQDVGNLAWALLNGLENVLEYPGASIRTARSLAADGEVSTSDRAAIAAAAAEDGSEYQRRRATVYLTPMITQALAIDFAERAAVAARRRGPTDNDSVAQARDIASPGLRDILGGRADRVARAAVAQLDGPRGNAVVRNLVIPDSRPRWSSGPAYVDRSVVMASERASVAEAIVRAATDEQLRRLEAPTVAYLLFAMQDAQFSEVAWGGSVDPMTRTYVSGTGPGVGDSYHDSMSWVAVYTKGQTPSAERSAMIERLAANAPARVTLERESRGGLFSRVAYTGTKLEVAPSALE